MSSSISNGYASIQVYSTYYSTLANSYAGTYIGGLGNTAITGAGAAYLKYTPKPIRRLLFNKDCTGFLAILEFIKLIL